MGEDDLLAHADERAETIRKAEADLLRIAYQWAIIHHPDRLDPAEADRPGRERARRLGGDGTPQVCEFAAAQLGARIGRSPYAAAQLMADALDLHHRLPQLWTRVEAGEVRASYARHVCKKTRDLTKDQAAFVDAAVAESADGRIPWSRFETLVEAKVAQAAPEAARAKEEQAAKATFAKKLRTEAHGMATFMVRADVATIDADRRRRHRQSRHADRDHARRRHRPAPGPRRPAHGPPRRHPRHRRVGPAAHASSSTCTPTSVPTPHPSPASRATARSPRPGSPASSAPVPVQDPPGPRPGRPGTRRRLRDPRPT